MRCVNLLRFFPTQSDRSALQAIGESVQDALGQSASAKSAEAVRWLWQASALPTRRAQLPCFPLHAEHAPPTIEAGSRCKSSHFSLKMFLDDTMLPHPTYSAVAIASSTSQFFT
jgi:hypothetical protein